MGTCKYCGKSTKLFSKSHKECEEKHSRGVAELQRLMAQFFQNPNSSSVQSERKQVISDCYLSAEDCGTCAISSVEQYAASLHRPYSASILQTIPQFLSVFGLSYDVVNKTGALARLSQKILKGHIADYFTGNIDINQMLSRNGKVKSVLSIPADLERETYYYMLNKAATNFLNDGLLSPQENMLINGFTQALNIQTNNLPAPYQNSDIAKITQANILTNLQNGVMPVTQVQLPILMAKGESLLWAYNNVNYYQEKVHKEFVGRHHGVSFKIAKGVYYRVGQSKGTPVEHSYMNNEGVGTLFVTNKNLIFNSPTKSLKIPFSKLVGVTPYSDGLEVHKDGAAKRIVFQGFDCWFVMNLLSMVNNI